ncbi:hypothetical protein AB0E01_18100 [Nocardia vinacea]|uniref:hypothetical protein n=1 Tax=Nocardia vinacea TaxID=96468 RepID=UPI0033C11308
MDSGLVADGEFVESGCHGLVFPQLTDTAPHGMALLHRDPGGPFPDGGVLNIMNAASLVSALYTPVRSDRS